MNTEIGYNKPIKSDWAHNIITWIVRCIIIFIIILMFSPPTVSAGSVQDTFESYVVGDLNGQGGWTAGTGWDIVTSPTQSGNRAVRNNDWFPMHANKNFGDSIYMGGYFRWENSGSQYQYNLPVWNGSTLVVLVRFNQNDGKLQTWNNNVWVDRATGLGLNTWYKLRVNITNTTAYDIYLDDVKKNTDGIISLNTTTTGYIKNITISKTDTGTVNFDTLFAGNTTEPMLISPSDGEIINITYPPLSQTTNFWWDAISASGWRIQIAEDSNFNRLIKDETIQANETNASTQTGKTYYWKLTNLTDNTISTVYSFSVVSNSTIAGKGIHGVVYELVGDIQTPLNGVTVFIYNTTYSTTQITGSNGYYLFTNLANDTYYVKATLFGYDDSDLQIVTVNGSVTTQDILMKKTTNQFVPIDHYVKFIVQDIWGTKYPNIAVNAYKGTSLTASHSGITGADGAITFLLIKDQSYRITAANSSMGINTDITLIPSEEEYYIIVSTTTQKWWEDGNQNEADSINFVITSKEINTTHAYINVTYTDGLGQTTARYIYLNQTNHSNGSAPQIILQSNTGTGNGTVSFIISGYRGNSYLVNLVAVHTTFGTIKRSFGVGFRGMAGGELDYITDLLKAIIGIAFLIFIGAMFGQTSKNQGAGVVVVFGWILFAFGIFAYFDPLKFGAGLTIATIFAIVVNMTERNRQEGMT